MIVITSNQTPEEQVKDIIAVIEKEGLQVHLSRGADHTVIGLVGGVTPKLAEHLRQMKGVENVVKISKSYKLASRDFHPEDTIIDIKGVKIGGENLVIMGGPCAVESQSRLMRSLGLLKRLVLRYFVEARLSPAQDRTASKA